MELLLETFRFVDEINLTVFSRILKKKKNIPDSFIALFITKRVNTGYFFFKQGTSSTDRKMIKRPPTFDNLSPPLRHFR